mgnify:CR=1 FL=1
MNTKILTVLAAFVVILTTGCASSQKVPDTELKYVCRNCAPAQQTGSQKKYVSIEEKLAADAGTLARQEEDTARLKLHRYCQAYAKGEYNTYYSCVEKSLGRGYLEYRGLLRPGEIVVPRSRCPDLFGYSGPCW